MKRLLTVTTFTLLCTHAFAAPVFHPPGPSLTYGAVSNSQTIISDITNPAAGASILTQEESRYRFGLNFGAGYEAGKVDEFVNQIDDVSNELEQSAQTFTITVDPLLTVQQNADVNAANINTSFVKVLNAQIALIGAESSYLKAFGSGNLPLVVAHQALGGSFVFNAGGSFVSSMVIMDDPLAAITGNDIVNAINNGDTTFIYNYSNNDTAAFVKAAAIMELSLGYSRSIWKHDAGELFFGARGNYYRVGLTRYAKRLMEFSSGQSSTDVFDDYSKDDYKESTGLGLDAGVLWVSEHYRAGATLNNINKPSFDYNEIDTTNYNNSAVRASLEESESYQMDTQLRLEAALFSSNTHWVISGAMDANAVKDPLDHEYQWLSLSAAYATDSWWVPGFRLGYRANMAGSEMSYITSGFTLFKSLTLDVAYGLESVKIEESDSIPVSGEMPRSMMLNLGFELTF